MTNLKCGIFIVDSHDAIRTGAKPLIEREHDMFVCGETDNPAEVLEMLDVSDPDVVIVDMVYPDGDGLKLICDIKKHYPGIKVLVLTMLSEELYAQEALHAGASGYVMKQEVSEKLVAAVRSILN